MPSRHHVPLPLAPGAEFDLPAEVARHVQVLRHQPGDHLHLFNGDGRQWLAEVTTMGRRDVGVRIVAADDGARDTELDCEVTLAMGMPANERMDALVEKATELGVAQIGRAHV